MTDQTPQPAEDDQRQLADMGLVWRVCALSLTPRKPGERIKNDQRDAIALARLHRAGELT